MTLFVVSKLSKAFGGVHAVDDLSFTLDAGERLAVIGPNGAGKSTCFDMLGGQRRPDRGTVHLDGRNVTGFKPPRLARHGIGRTFQITETFASMTVLENVQTALLAHRRRQFDPWSKARLEGREQARMILDRVGIENHSRRPCGELAYGDLKRVELAVALAGAPRLLLMDEPTAGMAPAERMGLMDLVSAIAAEDGTAVLFTEHDMDVVFGHADRVIVLVEGRKLTEGAPEAVRADPEVARVYLGGLGGAA